MNDGNGEEKVLTRREGAIAWLTFNQPQKRNAISLDMSVRAREVIEDFANDDTLHVLVVTGTGDKAFVSGADISEFEDKRNSAAAAAEYSAVSRRMFDALYEADKPTIAMIHGYCIGGGVGVAGAGGLRSC